MLRCRTITILFAAACLLLPLPGQSSPPELVRDINEFGTPLSSNPSRIVRVGSRALFTTAGGSLWSTDGTAQGTERLVEELFPRWIIPATGAVYYLGLDGLWVSRGTAATTSRISDVQGTQFDSVRAVVPGTRRIFFVGAHSQLGRELWTSDGTAQGTRMVIDLAPGIASPEIRDLTWFRGRLFFTGDDGVRGRVLWATDGTAAGTRVVKDLIPTLRDPTGPVRLAALSDRLVFLGDDLRGGAIWGSDGTTQGTIRLASLVRAGNQYSIQDARAVGDKYFLAAGDNRNGVELWVSNGRAAGTRVLTNFSKADPFGGQINGVFPFVQAANRIAFMADDGRIGREPWTSDGTVAGTRPVADLCPGPCASEIGPVGVLGGRLVYGARTAARGDELWWAGPSGVGLRLIKDVCPGACSSNASGFAPFGSRLAFVADDGAHGPQLYTTDGTPRGTVRVTDEPAFGAGPPTEIGAGLAVFSGADPEHGAELWRTDGRRAGTRFLVDLDPRQSEFSGSFPSDFLAAGERAVFLANDGEHGGELWASDGSEAGTTMLFELEPGEEPSFPTVGATDSDGARAATLIAANRAVNLVVTDGTVGGTRIVPPPGVSSSVGDVAWVGDGLYLTASEQGLPSSIWRSEGLGGTPQFVSDVPNVQWLQRLGTRLVFVGFADTVPSVRSLALGSSNVEELASVFPIAQPATLDGRLYFFGRAGEHIGLWTTDGTPAGTREVAPIAPLRGEVADGSAPIAGGDRLFLFGAFEGQAGLFVLVGDAPGHPGELRFVAPTPPDSDFTGAVFAGGRLFYTSGSPENPFLPILWSSDGTLAGTAPVPSAEGANVIGVRDLRALGDLVAFTALDGALRRVGISDGTAAGTQIFPGVRASDFVPPVVAGGRLFFSATDDAHGTELWKLEP